MSELFLGSVLLVSVLFVRVCWSCCVGAVVSELFLMSELWCRNCGVGTVVSELWCALSSKTKAFPVLCRSTPSNPPASSSTSAHPIKIFSTLSCIARAECFGALLKKGSGCGSGDEDLCIAFSCQASTHCWVLDPSPTSTFPLAPMIPPL